MRTMVGHLNRWERAIKYTASVSKIADVLQISIEDIEEQKSSRGVSIPSGDIVLAQTIVVARFLQMEDDNAATC